MPRQPSMKVTGLNGAQAMTMELEILTGTNSGATWLADETRQPTFDAKTAPTHSEVIQYLADGGRDISPNEEDALEAGKIINDRVAKHLTATGRKTPDGPKKPARPPEKKALGGLSAGLFDAAKKQAANMTDRIESQTTSSGGTADAVTDEYAERRQRKYNVNKSVVYVASSQLANALIKGKVQLFLANADVSGLLGD